MKSPWRAYDLLGVFISSPATCPREQQFLQNDQKVFLPYTLPRFSTEALRMSKAGTERSSMQVGPSALA